jgi:hypothetical protein
MPKTGHYATHNDIPMTVIQKQPTRTEPTLLAIPPTFSEEYSPRDLQASSPQSLCQAFGLNPLRLAQLNVRQPDFDHPFIYTPYICQTVYQLLQVDNQFPVEYHGLASDLHWPSNLAVYNPDPESNKWSSCAHYMGVAWERSPNPYLTANGGLTQADRFDIRQAVKLGWAFEDIWV